MSTSTFTFTFTFKFKFHPIQLLIPRLLSHRKH